MIILAIESSCDETAMAIVENGRKVISNVVYTQIAIHTLYGGVVPEVASREHIAKVTRVLKSCLEEAKMGVEDVDAIAVTSEPGLIGSLMVGINTAKTLSLIYNKPLLYVNHIHGHIYANYLEDDFSFPLLALVVSGGHTQVEAGNTRAVVAVTAVGFTENVKEPHAVGSNMAKPGDDIIMTKCIGIGGVQYIINNNREKILEKYVEDVVKRAYGNRSDLSIAKEACIAIENGAVSLHDMSQGGVYAALWDMAEASGTGLLVDFRAIAVRQEIIEICEIFDINPYELNSCGSLLITSSDSERIIKALAEEGIDACVIGKVTDSNDKIINNLDEVRFLDKPVQDEIYRLQEMQSETTAE